MYSRILSSKYISATLFRYCYLRIDTCIRVELFIDGINDVFSGRKRLRRQDGREVANDNEVNRAPKLGIYRLTVLICSGVKIDSNKTSCCRFLPCICLVSTSSLFRAIKRFLVRR